MRIGIDIMGGDYAPSKKQCFGAIHARNELPKEIELFLFGEEKNSF